MREIAGVPDSVPLVGTYDLLSTIMEQEGMQRMKGYLKNNPPPTPQHELKIILAFLNKYALDDAMDEDIDLPEFTHQLVDQLSEQYDADTDFIQSMQGVNFITP
jgi:hypothetical protein